MTASGARSYTYGVGEQIFGVWLGYMPGKIVSDRVIELLGTLHPLVVSQVEQLPLGPSITLGRAVDDEISAEEYQQAKRALYSRAGVKHWTEEFQWDVRATAACRRMDSC